MKLVIVGNGVAGATCAMAARKRDADTSIVMVGQETDYFFSRTALMYAFMDKMPRKALEPFERDVWSRQRIECVRDEAIELDGDARELTLRSGRKLAYDRLVLATGAKPNMFGWQGADAVKTGIVHFVSMQDLDRCESLVPTTRRAVVVGGGLIGIELVECLRHHGIEVTFLIREPWYWPMALGSEEAAQVTAHMRKHGVNVVLGDEIGHIEADSSGRVQAVKTKAGATYPCEMLGICVGVRPNVDAAKAFRTPPVIKRGFVVDASFRTSLPGVFACGDCAEIHRGDGHISIEQIWYSAKRQGELVGARAIWGDPVDYAPPIFFNSSKFFEIEYTTAGEVMSLADGTPTILMRPPRGDVSLRIVHDGSRVLGFNMLGSRWDHEVLQRWIAERRGPAWVVEHLREAQYDVEFGRLDVRRLERVDVPLLRAVF
jgi:NAD(P)H-nitrite reductase large subunit